MSDQTDDQKISSLQLGRIDTLVSDMHHRLFGNGQPGIVAEFNHRLLDLEADKNKVVGAARLLKIVAVSTPVAVAVLEGVRLWLRV